jgi:hypothetical protein
MLEADIKRVPELVPEEVAKQSGFKLDQKAPIVNRRAKRTPGVFQAGQADQGDLPGVGRIPQGRQESDPVWGDRVSLPTGRSATAEDWALAGHA